MSKNSAEIDVDETDPGWLRWSWVPPPDRPQCNASGHQIGKFIWHGEYSLLRACGLKDEDVAGKRVRVTIEIVGDAT